MRYKKLKIRKMTRQTKNSHQIEYESGGARTVKHAKLPISSFDESVREWRSSSVQEMLADPKIYCQFSTHGATMLRCWERLAGLVAPPLYNTSTALPPPLDPTRPYYVTFDQNHYIPSQGSLRRFRGINPVATKFPDCGISLPLLGLSEKLCFSFSWFVPPNLGH